MAQGIDCSIPNSHSTDSLQAIFDGPDKPSQLLVFSLLPVEPKTIGQVMQPCKPAGFCEVADSCPAQLHHCCSYAQDLSNVIDHLSDVCPSLTEHAHKHKSVVLLKAFKLIDGSNTSYPLY